MSSEAKSFVTVSVNGDGKPTATLWVPVYTQRDATTGKTTTTYFNDTCDPSTQYWDRENRMRWFRGDVKDEVRDPFVYVADEDDAADQMDAEIEEVCDKIEAIEAIARMEQEITKEHAL